MQGRGREQVSTLSGMPVCVCGTGKLGNLCCGWVANGTNKVTNLAERSALTVSLSDCATLSGYNCGWQANTHTHTHRCYIMESLLLPLLTPSLSYALCWLHVHMQVNFIACTLGESSYFAHFGSASCLLSVHVCHMCVYVWVCVEVSVLTISTRSCCRCH